jgi:hypothetical protein
MIPSFWQVFFVVYNFPLNLHYFFHFFPQKLSSEKTSKPKENVRWGEGLSNYLSPTIFQIKLCFL